MMVAWWWLVIVFGAGVVFGGIIMSAFALGAGEEAFREGYAQRIRDVGEVEGTPPWLVKHMEEVDGSTKEGDA